MAKSKSALLRTLNHLRRGERFNQNWSEQSPRSRDWEDLYRNRWRFDKVVRSTHGVNCTGSCSWKIHVKDGIIAFETQQTDYPSLGAEMPEYEPRGCPRGASFSWYEYSPLRVKYPYVRGDLLELWRAERQAGHDPVSAWRAIVRDPEKRARYQRARGKGGLVRATWEEVTELIAAACIDTIRTYGPDRVTGFSPIPAMSQVSYAGGARFLSLIGGTILSFYDWYADLPPASPQIWGDQTDVPESADWYNASYFIIWGTNLPMTRTPDAHFMVEARYNGTKVVGVSPDYAEYVKFADEWLPAKAGTDAALAMAMTHVILQEFYADRPTEYFEQYVKQYTDLPFLVTLEPHADGLVSGAFLRAADLGLVPADELGEWKTVLWDEATDAPAVPKGSIGFRYDGSHQWNLKLETADEQPIAPRLSFLGTADEVKMVQFPCFEDQGSRVLVRGVPAKKLRRADGSEVWVTTVFDLMMAHVGVRRGLPGEYPASYDHPMPYTPAWQEAITGVDRKQAIKIAREFADNAARTRGKSMIALGAGTNHWYHSDMIYRSIINLVLLTGCQGVNGGGWAHYVGQEKVRPLEGWSTVAFATDWVRPPRQQNGTSFYYFATDQFRYEELDTRTIGSPLGGRFHHLHPADMNALAVRLGWLPSFPQWTENSLEVAAEAKAAGMQTPAEITAYVGERLAKGDLHFAIEDPDNPKNFPRVFFVWRSNLLGSSSKGHEYFLKHLLGADGHVLGEESAWRPKDVRVTDPAPTGKVDLLVDIDFRMTGTALYSDIVLPAATWYEKHDLSSTDMHPFIHPFNPAISPPWETRTDWNTFVSIAEAFSRLAKEHLPAQDDIVMAPLSHDSVDELAQTGGKVRDWRQGEVEAIPGKTMPKLILVRRDYPHVIDMMTTMGPLSEKGYGAKGITISGERAYRELAERVGVSDREGPGFGRPEIRTELQAAEAILTLSGTTNGHRAKEEWQALSEITGLDEVRGVIGGNEHTAYTFDDLTAQPRQALATPVWSGLEGAGRRYSPFTANVEYRIPWHTLTGRQHFYLDHEVMLDFGEGLPLYRPPLGVLPFQKGDRPVGGGSGRTLMVRYLTPHQKWGIHSTYTDNHRMLTLFRGGQTIWISEEDAKQLGIQDNDWVEVYNRNGAIACRAVVSHRLPMGIAMMYHAQDRTIGVPGSAITGDRGGTHNSVTRIIPKPTHMIGGYAQLSYGFNYYGPTGHQRDVMAFIRPLKEVNWLED
ncbi:MAG: nitrate reductase subunit alpha [Alicyclobacillus macrosporangiidus]|uniref:nitrate reductase subunit alpha n=1 Tax=Alicyclobacillus macrosporangiidus TaxID=392015 RepID=UPI0026F2E13D|nr:nitrate reductase subunit alpha [Alicyclobacillus macrosporangiidus]MCL6597386.1 nitrate reductase subunit alpha [Alicyclobacillus macrosporangiidus]